MRVTLEDVARHAEVSLSAASRALNDRPGVKPGVRDRVLAAAAELGYRPNRSARNLASGLSSVIGLVIPTADLRVDPYGAALTHAVARAATTRDLGLMLHIAAQEPGETVHRILADGLIDGLLISVVAVGPAWVEELLDAPIPAVVIGSHPTRSDHVQVTVENVEASVAAVTHLFEQGCQRVGMITGRRDRVDAAERIEGYRLAHARAGREFEPELIVTGDFRRPAGMRGAAELLERGVDAIFASNDEMAVAAMWTVAHSGLRVPRDVKVVGFDGLAVDATIEPSLTSVAQPIDDIAGTAVDLLTQLIDGSTPESVQLEPTLVLGGSTERVG